MNVCHISYISYEIKLKEGFSVPPPPKIIHKKLIFEKLHAHSSNVSK